MNFLVIVISKTRLIPGTIRSAGQFLMALNDYKESQGLTDLLDSNPDIALSTPVLHIETNYHRRKRFLFSVVWTGKCIEH